MQYSQLRCSRYLHDVLENKRVGKDTFFSSLNGAQLLSIVDVGCREVSSVAKLDSANRRAAIFRHRWGRLGIAYVSRYSYAPPCNLSSPTSAYHRMRWLFSFILAFVWSVVVQAKSFTGNRLLVVLEDQAEREKYSVFLEDLTCKYEALFIAGATIDGFLCTPCGVCLLIVRFLKYQAVEASTWRCDLQPSETGRSHAYHQFSDQPC